jgi:precorrin-2 dehydrogenase/sirohydrochlorin ferrochelatase
LDAFPAFIPLKDARVVVIGEGEAAEAKARLFEASPVRLARLTTQAAQDGDAFAGARLVFIAIEDEALASRLAKSARAAGALVNLVDRPEGSDFLTPAIVDRGPVVGAISTGGAAPVLATRLRQTLEQILPEGLGDLAAVLRRTQNAVREALPDLVARRAFLRRQLDGEAAKRALLGDVEGAEQALLHDLSSRQVPGRGEARTLDDPGSDDGLTLSDLRFLGSADRIVTPPGASQAVLSHARRDALRCEALSPEALEDLLARGERIAVIRPVRAS